MIEYLKGDVISYATTYADTDHKVVIAHICNNIDAWGKGFTESLGKIWNKPRREYKQGQFNYEGTTFVFPVNKLHTIFVANMIAQRDVRSKICVYIIERGINDKQYPST